MVTELPSNQPTFGVFMISKLEQFGDYACQIAYTNVLIFTEYLKGL